MASRFLCLAAAAFLGSQLLALPLHAAEAPEATTEQSAGTEQNTPNSFIQHLGDKAISILADKSASPEARDATFRELMHQSFDLPTIARFVIGRNAWQGASQAEKDEYLGLFEKLVIRIYSDRFAMYSGETFKVVEAHQEGERDTIITSHIMRQESDQPIIVDWRVRNFDGRLGIIDVIVEGISMSVTQRQEYSSVLQRNDNHLQPLIELMRASLEKQDHAENK